MPPRARPAANDLFLVADTRERSIIPFLVDVLAGEKYPAVPHCVRQINTGDYLVCRRRPGAPDDPWIEACVERKTLQDFASSFVDGRYDNLRKMIELRARTGCRLFWIVEGPAFPNPNRRFGPIPASSIVTAMTNLMVRDGVFIIQTEDEPMTAKRLADLVRSIADPSVEPPSEDTGGGAGEISGDNAEAVNEDFFADPPEMSLPQGLTSRIEPTDAEVTVEMWSGLRGVSAVLGKILSQRFSFREFLTTATDAEIDTLKTATGRKINKEAMLSLKAFRRGELAICVRVLCGINNVTPTSAGSILGQAGSMERLLAYSVAQLAEVKIPQKTREISLGKVRAEKILHYLTWKSGGEAAATTCAKPATKPAAVPAVAPVTKPPVLPDFLPPAPTVSEPPPEPIADTDFDNLLGD